MAHIKKIKRKKGTVYKAEVRLRGRQYTSRTFRKLSDARNWAMSTEKMIRFSADSYEDLSKEHSLSALTEEVEKLKKEIGQLKEDLRKQNREGGDYGLYPYA